MDDTMELENPDAWRPAQGERGSKPGDWRCIACCSGWMPARNRVRHERSDPHRRLYPSWKDSLNIPSTSATRMEDIPRPEESVVQAVVGSIAQIYSEFAQREYQHEHHDESQLGVADLPPNERPDLDESIPRLKPTGFLDDEPMSVEHIGQTVVNWLHGLHIDMKDLSDEEALEIDEGEESEVSDQESDVSESSQDLSISAHSGAASSASFRWSTKQLLEENTTWFPWPDKISCLLDILHHLPRSVFSEAQMETITWSHQVMGFSAVPTHRSMKRVEKLLQRLCGIESIRYEGALGHVYYVNDMGKIIAQEMSNPHVRPHLKFFPEERKSGLSDASHFARWREEIDPQLATPMVSVDNQDFFIFEPTLLTDGSYCIPVRWFIRDEKFFADAWPLQFNQCGWIVHEYETTQVPLSTFLASFPYLCSSFVARGIPDPRNIIGCYKTPTGDLEEWNYTEPEIGNKWRALSKGHRVVSFPIWLYCDDTSGNTSKKWNKHNSFLFTPAGLPHDHAHMEYHIHFLSTSNIAPPLEMLDGIAEQMKKAQENGIWAWDCVDKVPILVIPFILAVLGDNPMQSELSCHIGLHGKLFCRCCFVQGREAEEDGSETRSNDSRQTGDSGSETGASETSGGTQEEQGGTHEAKGKGKNKKKKRRPRKTEETGEEMIDRIRRFLKINTLRNRKDTLNKLKTIFTTAKTAGKKTKSKELKTEFGVKDVYQDHFLNTIFDFIKQLKGTKEEKQKQIDNLVAQMPAVDDLVSPIWRIQDGTVVSCLVRTGVDKGADLDPHRDTPVEILHVILLGFVKYFWRDAVARVGEKKHDLLIARLASIDTRGLGISRTVTARTLVKYAGSLVGRDFRVIAQVTPFVLHGLVPQRCYEAWLALSDLVPRVWQPIIDDLEEYLFLLATTRWTPRWFNKPKFHIILHLPSHIRRLGPAILFATESFESYNGLIRGFSVHSNRQAPSRDIARSFASNNRLRHLLSHGFIIKDWSTALLKRRISTANSDSEGSETEGGPVSQPREELRFLKDWARLPIPDQPKTSFRQVGQGVTNLVFANGDTISKAFRIPAVSPQQAVRVKFVKSPPGAVNWEQTESYRALPQSWSRESGTANYMYRMCSSCILPDGDRCKIGFFVLANVAFQDAGTQRFVGKVLEMLQIPRSSAAANAHPSFFLLQLFSPYTSSEVYGMPALQPKLTRTGHPHCVMVSYKDLICLVNVQHNCAKHNCLPTPTRRVREEREDRGSFLDEISHTNLEDLILNIGQMRNARLLRDLRPRIIEPSPEEITRSIEEGVAAALQERKVSKQKDTSAASLATATALRVQSVLNASRQRQPSRLGS